jgi:Tol biopolymer transport system component
VKTLIYTLFLSLALATTHAQTAAKHKVLFNRFRVPEIAVFIADADGQHERALTPHHESEYSPSITYDGKWVVFTDERAGQSDIYRAHPDGSGLERLTTDPAFDDQGALSPNGATLAFVSTRADGYANIWLLDITSGKYRNLTPGAYASLRPAWSPDGAWIAFSSDRDSAPGAFPGQWEMLQSTGIYIVHPDGTGLRRVTRAGGAAGSPSWSADGKKILFYETDEVGAFLAKGARSRTEIVSIDLASGERVQYTASNETKLSPKWLPGGRISYAIRSTAADTEGLRIWNPNRKVDTIVKGHIRNPGWSAGGAQVVYERVLQPASTEHLVPTVSRDPEFELVLSEPFPSFSPDGARLLYSEYGNNGLSAGDTTVKIMRADGTDQKTLYRRAGFTSYDSVWSPAGDLIAFCLGAYFRAPGTPGGQIVLINPDGTGLRVLADDGVNNGFPSWSPDGKRIVYRRGKQLAIVNVADNKVTTLTDGSHYDNFPQWSPKGDVIMFTSDREDSQFSLYTVHPDGSGVRRLTKNSRIDAHSIWSNDGEWIVFSSGRKGFKDEMALYDGTPQPYGEIFAMRADGSGVRQLTDNKWEDSSPGWAPEPRGTQSAQARRPASTRVP